MAQPQKYMGTSIYALDDAIYIWIYKNKFFKLYYRLNWYTVAQDTVMDSAERYMSIPSKYICERFVFFRKIITIYGTK